MKQWLPRISVVAVLLVAYIWLLRSPERGRSASVEAAEQAQPDVAEPTTAPPSVPPVQKPAVEGPAKPPSESEQAAPNAPPNEWRSIGNPARILKPAFDQETRDALWADREERAIEQLLEDNELPPELVQDVACRRTVCRLELRWTADDHRGMGGVTKALGQRYQPPAGLAYPKLAEPMRGLDLYLLREGYTLDDLEE